MILLRFALCDQAIIAWNCPSRLGDPHIQQVTPFDAMSTPVQLIEQFGRPREES